MKKNFSSLSIEKQKKIIKRNLRRKIFGVRIYYRGGVRGDGTLIVWFLWVPVFIYEITDISVIYKIMGKRMLLINTYDFNRGGWE